MNDTNILEVADRLHQVPACSGHVLQLYDREIINIKLTVIPVTSNCPGRKRPNSPGFPFSILSLILPADMSTPVNKNDSGSEKPDVVHQDDALFRTASEAGPEKPVPRIAKVDYSGAYEKTDPKEIALVKKLDRWIMPMLWCKSSKRPTG